MLATLMASLAALSGCGGSSGGPPASYTLGGTVAGLAAGVTVVLLDNSGDSLSVTANGTFTFATALDSGATYAVTVGTQPGGQTCSVAGGTGTIGTANISNVVVTCSDQAFSLGGTIAGLNGPGLVLANGTDTVSVSSGDTTFTFPSAVAYTSSYAVTVETQPAGLACSVSGGTGTMPAANVANVAVSCTDQPFSLGGTISGLGSNAGLVLANGTDTLSVPAGASTFTLPQKVAFGSPYAVTVQSPPPGLTCSVSGGSGTMPAGNVTSVAVTCSDQSYALGGTISGLTAPGLVLANGSSTVVVPANATSFTLPHVAYTSSYAVTVQAQPTGLTCSVANGSGTMGTSAVTNIAVTCAPVTYTVGGTITGLVAETGLVLANGTDTLTVLANATTFTMPAGVAYGSTYDVSVQAHPPGLDCTVSNGSGTVSASDVTNIAVSCTAGTVSAQSFDGTDGEQPVGLMYANGTFVGTTNEGGAAGAGTVFTLAPGGAPTLLHSFTATDGSGALAGVIQASDGNFYGTTEYGGASGFGTVFKITPAGTETVLYSFTGNTTDGGKGGTIDGGNPAAGLIQASDGNFYGTTSEGGATNGGTVFRITPAGTETVLYSFQAGTDGNIPAAGLIQASDGNFYGTTLEGGASGLGTVFKITPAGTETVLYTFQGGTDGNGPFAGLIQLSDGNFYGTTTSGGAAGLGTVFKITPAGTETVLYSFQGGTDGINPYAGLIQLSDGNFYGTTESGGASGNGTVFKITPAGVETVLYSFTGGTDGSAPFGPLVQAPNGDLYGTALKGGADGDGTVFVLN